MRLIIRFACILAVSLCVCSGTYLYPQTQTDSPRCHADSSQRDKGGYLPCCSDGRAPEGEKRSQCKSQISHGDYLDPKYEYEVHVPDGIAEHVPCGMVFGFLISLVHPEGGEGDMASNLINVSGGVAWKSFQERLDAWSQRRKDSESNPDSGLQFDEPEQTSLSSLPALRFKSVLTKPDLGTIITEEIVANNPNGNYSYSILMFSPADKYEKNQKLFKAIVDGFHYVPTAQAANQ